MKLPNMIKALERNRKNMMKKVFVNIETEMTMKKSIGEHTHPKHEENHDCEYEY
jgi:hypothetical protein